MKLSKDVVRSIVLGPGRLLLPVGYLLLYKLIISEFGFSTFGLWSMFASVMSYALLIDIGFSQLLMREGRVYTNFSETDFCKDYLSTVLFYLFAGILGLTFLLILFLIFDVSSRIDEVQLNEGILFWSIVGAIVGSVLKLASRSNHAVLAVYELNYFAVGVQVVASILLIVLCGIFVFLDLPIVGFSISYFVASLFEFFVSFKRMKSVSDLRKFPEKLGFLKLSCRAIEMIFRGRFLYLSSLGGLIREPLVRGVIISCFGLIAVGIFDIALRLTKTVRESIASGFSSTFPVFSRLIKNGEISQINAYVNDILAIVLPFGTFALSFLLLLQKPIYELWLGEHSSEIELVTFYLIVWHWITLFNIPFWFLALASKEERAATLSLWIHTGLVALLPIWIIYLKLDLVNVIQYWLISSLITQILIIGVVIRRITGIDFLCRSLKLQISLALVTFSVGAVLWKLNEAISVFSVLTLLTMNMISIWIGRNKLKAFITNLRSTSQD